MSANLLAIYCLISSADRLAAQELYIKDIYNLVQDKFSNVSDSVSIPVLSIISIALLIIILWLMFWWCCDESTEESTQSIEFSSPKSNRGLIVDNHNQSQIVSIQNTSTSKPKAISKGSVKTEVLRSPLKGLSIRLGEQSENGQSIDANISKQTTNGVKNESQEKTYGKNTMVSLNLSQKIVSTSNKTATTEAQHNV